MSNEGCRADYRGQAQPKVNNVVVVSGTSRNVALIKYRRMRVKRLCQEMFQTGCDITFNVRCATHRFYGMLFAG